MPQTKIQTARAAGYGDNEILEHMLKSGVAASDKVSNALASGYSVKDVIDHFDKADTAPVSQTGLAERRKKAGGTLSAIAPAQTSADTPGGFVRQMVAAPGEELLGSQPPKAESEGLLSNIYSGAKESIPTATGALASAAGSLLAYPFKSATQGYRNVPGDVKDFVSGLYGTTLGQVSHGVKTGDPYETAGGMGKTAAVLAPAVESGIKAGAAGIEALRGAKAPTPGVPRTTIEAATAPGSLAYRRARNRPVTSLGQTPVQKARATLDIGTDVLPDERLAKALDKLKEMEPKVKGGVAATADQWAEGLKHGATDLNKQLEQAMTPEHRAQPLPGLRAAMEQAEIDAIPRATSALDKPAYDKKVASIRARHEGQPELTTGDANDVRVGNGQKLREYYKKGPSAQVAAGEAANPAELKAQRDVAAKFLYEGTNAYEHANPQYSAAFRELNDQLGAVTRLEDAIHEKRGPASIEAAKPSRMGLRLKKTPGPRINEQLSDVMRTWPTKPKPVPVTGAVKPPKTTAGTQADLLPSSGGELLAAPVESQPVTTRAGEAFQPAIQLKTPLEAGPELTSPLAGERVHPVTGERVVDTQAPQTPTSLATETLPNVAAAPLPPQTDLTHPLQVTTAEIPRVQGEAIAQTPVNVQSRPPLPIQTELTHPLAQVGESPITGDVIRREELPQTQAQVAPSLYATPGGTGETTPRNLELGIGMQPTGFTVGGQYMPPTPVTTPPGLARRRTLPGGLLSDEPKQLGPAPTQAMLPAPTGPAETVPTGGTQGPGVQGPAPAPVGQQTVTPTLSTEPRPQMAAEIERVTQIIQRQSPGIDPRVAQSIARDVVGSGTQTIPPPEVPPAAAAVPTPSPVTPPAPPAVQAPPPAPPQAPAGLTAPAAAMPEPLPVGSLATQVQSDVPPAAATPPVPPAAPQVPAAPTPAPATNWRTQSRYSMAPMTATEEADIDSILAKLNGERSGFPPPPQPPQADLQGFLQSIAHLPGEMQQRLVDSWLAKNEPGVVAPQVQQQTGGLPTGQERFNPQTGQFEPHVMTPSRSPAYGGGGSMVGGGGETVLPLGEGAPMKPPPSPQGLHARRSAGLSRAAGNSSEAQLHHAIADQFDAQAAQQQMAQVADQYAQQQGMSPFQQGAPEVNEARSQAVADFYDKAQSMPNDPEVRSAYSAFNNETGQQFEYLKQQGFTFEPTDNPAPYASQEEMARDLDQNRHLSVWTGGTPEHGLITPEQNFMFRAVHDTLGHVASGGTFGHAGEEAAYAAHKQMYSPEAQKAMATETRGQNAALHFSKSLDNPAETRYQDMGGANLRFPEQKATILPPELREVGPGAAPAGAVGSAEVAGGAATPPSSAISLDSNTAKFVSADKPITLREAIDQVRQQESGAERNQAMMKLRRLENEHGPDALVNTAPGPEAKNVPGFLTFRKQVLAEDPNLDPRLIRPMWEEARGLSPKSAALGLAPDAKRGLAARRQERTA